MSDAGFVEASLRATAQELFAGGTELELGRLLALGWDDLVSEEPRTAVTVLAEEQGRALGSSRLVELVMGRILGINPKRHALAFALGTTTCGTEVDAVLLADADAVSEVIVPIRSEGGIELASFEAATLRCEPVVGIDPAAQWGRVRGDAGLCTTSSPTLRWPETVAAGSLALAHELLGVVSHMLDIAVEHVKERHQFGVAIGSFQAVQHRLADTFVQAEAARAVTRTAWAGQDRATCTAALAAARRAADAAIEHCHQVFGAMGCTWEHPLHRFIRRALLLSLLLDPDEDLRSLVLSAVVTGTPVEVLV